MIDPKGLVGEREFELGAYLRSPIYDFPDASTRKQMVACSVISLLWFLEDYGSFDEVYLQNVQILNEIKF